MKQHYPRSSHAGPSAMRGAALLSVLLMLTVIMLLGMATAHMALINEKSARNSRDRQIAFAAAEAALRDAILDLANGRAEQAAFELEPGSCHAHGTYAGLCRGHSGSALPSSQQLAQAVAFGSFSGRRWGSAPASSAPRYLIELIDLTPAATAQASPLLRYRITALGFGTVTGSRVALQSVHAASLAPGSQAIRPGQRLSWRNVTDLIP